MCSFGMSIVHATCLVHMGTGLRDVFESEDGWYLVLELVTGGELFERLVHQGAYSEKEASSLFRQIGEAINYLHAQAWVGRVTRDGHVTVTGSR